jgi:hypothetical protein
MVQECRTIQTFKVKSAGFDIVWLGSAEESGLKAILRIVCKMIIPGHIVVLVLAILNVHDLGLSQIRLNGSKRANLLFCQQDRLPTGSSANRIVCQQAKIKRE